LDIFSFGVLVLAPATDIAVPHGLVETPDSDLSMATARDDATTAHTTIFQIRDIGGDYISYSN
jgi:hypothetical protein